MQAIRRKQYKKFHIMMHGEIGHIFGTTDGIKSPVVFRVFYDGGIGKTR
jgi:hypothetical protein